MEIDFVSVAYRKLKQMVYYDRTHLHLRQTLAEFECGHDVLDRLGMLGDLLQVEDPTKDRRFKNWLGKINYVLTPKAVRKNAHDSVKGGTFVSNVTTDSKYEIDRVNFIFDGPIELHLIAVLWIMFEGHKLDNRLPRYCNGSRLNSVVGNDDDRSALLFKKYHELYSQWRDMGVNKAREMLINEERSVCIISLDFQEFYYRIELNWSQLKDAIDRPMVENEIDEYLYGREMLGGKLLGCLEAICKAYKKSIQSALSETHVLPPTATCLPIGLCSSPIIANWYLAGFDEDVMSNVRPAYYGRYVDDILLVVASDNMNGADPVRDFMDQVMEKSGVMRWSEDLNGYQISRLPCIFLQKSKCVLQYFDASHSIGGLEKFKKQLEANASSFALLPVDGEDNSIEQVAYDLLYDGSENKLRNVKDIGESKWELAQYLAKQTQMHLVAGQGPRKSMEEELRRFFKGRNAIEYWDMWERVLSLFVVSGRLDLVDAFYGDVKMEVGKVEAIGGGATRRVKNFLREHLDIARELSLSLKVRQDSIKYVEGDIWRHSNMLRHHLVMIPLLNYTNFEGDFTRGVGGGRVKLVGHKVEFSPRYVHFDECLSFVESLHWLRRQVDSITAANEIYAKFYGSASQDVNLKVVKGGEESEK